MTPLKSSEVRTGLAKLIGGVLVTRDDVLIEQNGDVVAKLTLTAPSGAVTPMRMKIMEAREGWSKLLESVTRGAQWYFVLKREENTRVFLVRHEAYNNPFVEKWRGAVRESRRAREVALTAGTLREIQAEMAERLEGLSGDINALQHKIACMFAFANRGGDLLAFPDCGVVPVRDSDDLERF